MHRPSLLTLLAALLLAAPLASLAQQPLPIAPDLGLESTVFAADLPFPAGMAALPDGSILVGTSVSTGNGYYDSTGEILRLVDTDADGVADLPYQTVVTGLPGSITSLALAGDLLLVTSTAPGNEAISVLRMTPGLDGPYTLLGTIEFRFISALHTTYGLATRPHPDEPNAWDVVFAIGANGNDRGGSRLVRLSGLIEADLADSSVYLTTLRDDGETITFTQPIAVATGIRNTSAMAFHPATGDLWIAENGIDGLEDPFVSLSADELDVVPADAIGTEPIDFGFPSTYTRYDTGEVVGSTGAPPFVVFRPLDGSESEGIASLAVIPETGPPGLRGGLVAGFHGQFDLTGLENEENPVLWIDPSDGAMRTVVPNDAPTVGHIDTILATGDALYFADLCADGFLWQLDPCGVIYRVTAAP